jgi:hypothetical protein
LKSSRVVPKRPRVLLLKVFNSTRVILMKEPYGKCDLENRIPYGMYPPSLRSNHRFQLRVNLMFCQSYPVKSGEKFEGHVAQSPRALRRVLPLELKGHLDCRMCPEWVLKLVVTHRIDLS